MKTNDLGYILVMLARDPDAPTAPDTVTEETAAHRQRRTRGHVASYGEGRLCNVEDCQTRLSRYNAAERCAAHDRDPVSAS